MIVLGIETSCDETAAALVTDDRRILANVVHTQLADHAPFGGVVPEIAARAHVQHLPNVLAETLARSGLSSWAAVDAIAATAGPGLVGGVMVGMTAAKAMAQSLGKPFYAINHLEGHALTARLTDDVPFPYLLLLISGGHSFFALVEGVGRYRVLGGTIDDSLGEAFDKTAKMMGLGYPGGAALEALARSAADGQQAKAGRDYPLPRPMKGKAGCDFSFSGLKTAVRLMLDAAGEGLDRPAFAWAFHQAIAEIIRDRLATALGMVHDRAVRHVVVAGGVAANGYVRAALAQTCAQADVALVAPPPALCTDNGAMIAWAGLERLRLGLVGDDVTTVRAQPRWPLDQIAAA
jgi:N6-L-threonylcarbamoyladenine synthase